MTALIKAFPSLLSSDVERVAGVLPPADIPTHVDERNSFFINREHLCLPSRVYFSEPPKKKTDGFNLVQKQILFCIFTRHHDGHIREKYLRELIAGGVEDVWVVPYVIQLIEEYVVEIIGIIEAMGDSLNRSPFPEFLKENPEYFELTKKRVVSYWNKYYRDQPYPKKDDYPGFKLIQRLEKSLT